MHDTFLHHTRLLHQVLIQYDFLNTVRSPTGCYGQFRMEMIYYIMGNKGLFIKVSVLLFFLEFELLSEICHNIAVL